MTNSGIGSAQDCSRFVTRDTCVHCGIEGTAPYLIRLFHFDSLSLTTCSCPVFYPLTAELRLICAFISRREAEQILSNASEGTFLVRLSERSPGSFALAHVAEKKSDMGLTERYVRHYLLQPEDVVGAHKTLPDFLAHEKLTNIVQLETNRQGHRRYIKLDKDEAIGEFYSPRVKEGGKQQPDGYERRLFQ